MADRSSSAVNLQITSASLIDERCIVDGTLEWGVKSVPHLNIQAFIILTLRHIDMKHLRN